MRPTSRAAVWGIHCSQCVQDGVRPVSQLTDQRFLGSSFSRRVSRRKLGLNHYISY